MIQSMKKIHVGDSPIAGKGVFVSEPVKAGEVITQIDGKVVKRHIRTEKGSARFANWIGMGEGVWLNPNKTKFRFLNHSCKPSAAIVDGHQLIALKDLKEGDEVTFDYSLTDTDVNWRMECSCGAENCRKVIQPIYFVPPEVFKTHYPNIPQYFQHEFFRNYVHTHEV